MTLLIVFVLTVCVGLIGYRESSRLEKRFRTGPLGQPAWRWAAVAAVVGMVAAFISPAVTLAGAAGYAAYAEAAQFEAQFRREVIGVPAYAWAALGFVFGLLGAAFASPFAWIIVCALLGLGGEVTLLAFERRTLVADNARLRADPRRAAPEPRREQPAPPPAAAAPDPRRPAAANSSDLIPERRFW